ncbi:MAG TPA: hypothetical protein VMW52_05495 [Phycisphaerae bacterium]|nr:hypothetical protein [Phycisphaerae bacterium]
MNGDQGVVRVRKTANVGMVVLGMVLGAWMARPLRADGETADYPQTWLVVFNSASSASREWASWYAAQRGIPAENLLGLPMSSEEHLPDLATARVQVFDPVRAYLADHPEIEQHILGILAGYEVPGHYGEVPFGPPGGYSIANGLQDLTNEEMEMNPQCAELDGELPPRLSKQTLLPGHYLVGRIDARALDLAQEITLRAQVLEDHCFGFGAQKVWYDYRDDILPQGEWYWLREAVENPMFEGLPWVEFDADTEQTLQAVFRFGTHDVDGWNDARLYAEPGGARVLAYNLNSWGMTTSRDPDAEGGRYVPNAIEAGYAAAIGATGEPASVIGPFPWVLLAALREGWTLGEAMYLANPWDDWVWTCVGDPLLHLQDWPQRSVDGAASQHTGEAQPIDGP